MRLTTDNTQSPAASSDQQTNVPGSVEHCVRLIQSERYTEMDLDSSPTSDSDIWVEGEIDYTKEFFYFEHCTLSIYNYPRQYHLADMQVNSEGVLIIQFAPDANQYNDSTQSWRDDKDWIEKRRRWRDELISARERLRQSGGSLSLVQKIYAWASVATELREAYREKVFHNETHSAQVALQFPDNTAPFNSPHVHPILMNSHKSVQLGSTPVNTSEPHIRIERYALNGRRKTQLLGLLSIPEHGELNLNLLDEWNNLSDTQRYGIKMALVEDIWNGYDSPWPKLNLLTRCLNTTMAPIKHPRNPKPEISFTYINDQGEEIELNELKSVIAAVRHELVRKYYHES